MKRASTGVHVIRGGAKLAGLVRRYPIIIGPTAGGKSDLAVQVAHGLARRGAPPAEIITADAYQIFRGLDIGTAKPAFEERGGIPHHLIDVVDARERFSVHDWLMRATRTIEEVRSRGSTPIVVGGTHLYIKALLDGLFEGPGPDAELRARLAARPLAELRAELERVDPGAAARIHPNDARRTVRALEVFRLTGRPISEHQRQWDRPHTIGRAGGSGALGAEDQEDSEPAGGRVLVGLDWPAELLNPRINARVKSMIERGLVEEARTLWSAGAFEAAAAGWREEAGSREQAGVGGDGPARANQAREALGYKQLIEHFEGRCTLEEAVERIKIETRRFAKNQRTWLKRLRLTPGSVWIDAAATPREQWPAIVIEAMSRDVR